MDGSELGSGVVPPGGAAGSAAHPPSRVLYVRNVPDRATEQDVVTYCVPFGRVSNVLLLRDKHHGFVEFEDQGAATACLRYYSENGLFVNSLIFYFFLDFRSAS